MAKKILIVEDEEDLVTMAKMRLERNGYEVVFAFDGEEGLKKVYQERPDLILLDLIMPKMDGFTACRRLKKDPDTKNIPILVITAAGIKDIEQQCKDNHAEGFIKKPYEPQEFLAKIKSFLK
jgi:two-component system phosphate regulon response regulator PhoB